MSELPEGWAGSTIGECFLEVKNGTTVTQNKLSIGIPVTRIETIQRSRFDLNRVQHIENPPAELVAAYRYKDGDIAFSHINSLEHVGKTALYEGNPETLIHGMNLLRLRRRHEYIYPKYAHYFMLSDFFREEVRKRVGHAVNQVSINQKNLSEVPFIVAPLNEQHRIVEKLEKLLSKVEASQRRLERIPLILKRFRLAVLAAACAGRLTVDWREIHKEESVWETCELGSICNFIGGSQPPKSKFIYEPKEGYIRLIQIRDYKSDNHLTFIPKDLARRTCTEDDVMIGRYGPPLFQILRGIEGAYNVALMKAVPKLGQELSNDFLFVFLQNPPLQNYIINASERTVGQDGVRKDLLEKYEINLPSISEQQEIVNRVTSLFKVADHLEERYKKAKAHVDKLTQSILAKAFRGELVPTEAELARQEGRDYEPASVLLERIRRERTKAQSKDKPVRKSRKKRATATKGMFA